MAWAAALAEALAAADELADYCAMDCPLQVHQHLNLTHRAALEQRLGAGGRAVGHRQARKLAVQQLAVVVDFCIQLDAGGEERGDG